MSGYPENVATKVWKKDDLTFSIVKLPDGNLSGFVRFPKKILNVESTRDYILSYVPMFTELSYLENNEDGSQVFGWNTVNLNSWRENTEELTLEKIKRITEKMADDLIKLSKYEVLFRRLTELRIEIVNLYLKEVL